MFCATILDEVLVTVFFYPWFVFSPQPSKWVITKGKGVFYLKKLQPLPLLRKIFFRLIQESSTIADLEWHNMYFSLRYGSKIKIWFIHNLHPVLWILVLQNNNYEQWNRTDVVVVIRKKLVLISRVFSLNSHRRSLF